MENERSSPQHPRLRRLRGSATSAGPEYEFKLAGLVALRARRLGFQFELFSNVAAARPCDDLVLRVHYPYKATVFVQLKHSRGQKILRQHSFLGGTSGFFLAKYFAFFRDFSTAMAQRETITDEDMLLLTDCAMENVHFVLYSPKSFSEGWCGGVRGGYEEGVGKSSGSGWDSDRESSEDSSEDTNFGGSDWKHGGDGRSVVTGWAYETLLSTCEGGVYRFGPKDSKVWSLFGGKKGEEQYQKEFLPRLALFHSQASADALDAFILREINLLFGAPLPPPCADHLLVQYLAALKDWAQNDTRGFCLSHSSRELEKALGGVLESAGRAAMGRGLLHFQDEHCRTLRASLSRSCQLVVTVCGIHQGFRFAKLFQILEADYGGRWTYVNEEVANELPPAALTAACAARGGVVVVDGDKELRERVLRQLRMAWPLRSTVVLRAPGEELGAEQQGWEEVHEDWRLAHLSPLTQEQLLDKELLFQGQVVRLRDLQETWPHLLMDVDGALINALLQGVAAIGSVPSSTCADCGGGDDLHVLRTLEHANTLSDAVLSLRRETEHLALSGFPADHINWMEEQRLGDEINRSFSAVSSNGRQWQVGFMNSRHISFFMIREFSTNSYRECSIFREISKMSKNV